MNRTRIKNSTIFFAAMLMAVLSVAADTRTDLEGARAEAVRSHALIRGATTQPTKTTVEIDVEPDRLQVKAVDRPRLNIQGLPGVSLTHTRIRADAEEVRRGQIEGDKHDALRIHKSDDVIVDGVSLSGAVDEVMSITASRGVNVRNTIISKPSRDLSLHPDGHAHDYGLLIVGVPKAVGWGEHAPVLVERCLIADIGGRGPTLAASFPDHDDITSGVLHCRLVNNVVWQPLYAGLKIASTNPDHHVGTVKADIVGNLYILTDQSDAVRIKRIMQAGDWEDVYAKDNWIMLRDGSRHDLFAWAGVTPGRNEPNFDVPDYIADPDELLDAVLGNAGARPLDDHDQRIIRAIRGTE